MLCLTVFVCLYSIKYFLKILNGDSRNTEFHVGLKEWAKLLFMIKVHLKCLDFMGHWVYLLPGLREIPHVLLLIELKCQYTSSPILESALWLGCSNAKTNYLCLHLAVNTVPKKERRAGCSKARTLLALCGESTGDPSNLSCMGPKEKLIWESAVLTLGSVQLPL